MDKDFKLNERRAALLKRIKKLRGLHTVYSPAAIQIADNDDASRLASADTPAVEDLRLYLPSDLPATHREKGCVPGLVEKELSYVRARRDAAMNGVRHYMNTLGQVIRFRNLFVQGQREGTKSGSIIERLGVQAAMEADKFNDSVTRLDVLDPKPDGQRRRILKHDLAVNTVIATDDHSRRQTNAVATAGEVPTRTSTLRTSVSWIWSSTAIEGGGMEDDDDLNGGLDASKIHLNFK